MRIDFFAFLLVFLFLICLYGVLKKTSFGKRLSFIHYSSIQPLRLRTPSWKEKFFFIPYLFLAGGSVFFLIAFIDPHFLQEDSSLNPLPREGMAIYLLLDRSGSMGTVVEKQVIDNAWQSVTRFDVLKQVTLDFIDKNPKNLLGVVAFGRSPQVISPLTLDHTVLKERVRQLSVIKDPAQSSTAIGYAIYKTAHLIASLEDYQKQVEGGPLYEVKNAIMIIITDGFQDPSILDRGNRLRTMELEEAANYAKSKNIKIYIVNIDPVIKEERFAPNRHELERAVQTTGGQLIITQQINDLQSSLEEIQKIEKNRINTDEESIYFKKIPIYPYLLKIGLLLLGIGILLHESIWRRVL